jgi:hypothetical protein
VLVGVLLMMGGLVAAVAHNYLRRRCSLVYEQHTYRPPSDSLWGWNLGQPTICFVCWVVMMGISLGAFIVAGLVVAIVGMCTL